MLMRMMREAGYEHYEISNFALEGFRSRHNSSYWKGEKYIGIGPSAHSYNGRERFWNKDNNSLYIQSLQQDRIPFEKELLTENQQLEEYIMTSLRTSEGMDLGFVESHFSGEERTRIGNVLRNVEKKNYTADKDRIVLTDEGKLFADGIAVRLFR
jgi:oxygen-independent coproporphyrinogen-3 oxidase